MKLFIVLSLITSTAFASSSAIQSAIWLNNITSNTSGQERMERAGITNNGSTCAVGSQSGTWLSGCSRVSTGLVTLTIVAGEFTSAPICVCTHSTDTTNYADVCNISGSPTTTSVSVQIYNAQSQVARDDPFTIHCMGPR